MARLAPSVQQTSTSLTDSAGIISVLSSKVIPSRQETTSFSSAQATIVITFWSTALEIMGLIYWEWTQTVSKAEAFCSPCIMWPLREFYDGSNELIAYELQLAAIFWEKGRGDLANYAMDGGKVKRLFFSLGPERSFVDTQALSNLYIGLQKAFNRYEDRGSWTRLLRSGKMMNCSLTC